MQQPFSIPYQNLDTCIFLASAIKYFSLHYCKCNSLGCTTSIRCGSACHGPHSDRVYWGNEHNQFDSLRLVKREVGFSNPRQVLIGSNQLWRVNDSPYYREFERSWNWFMATLNIVYIESVPDVPITLPLGNLEYVQNLAGDIVQILCRRWEGFQGTWRGIYILGFNTLKPRQIAAIFQTTFSNAFSWMKMY